MTDEKSFWPIKRQEKFYEEISIDDDRLGRMVEIKNLTPLLLNTQGPFTFALDAPWGHGKTMFSSLWARHLEGEGANCLYLNAWEHDYVDEPLIPLLTQFGDYLNQGGGKESKDNLKKLVSAARLLIRGTGAAASLATGISTFDSLAQELEQYIDTADKKDNVPGFELIEMQRHLMKTMQEFRKSLEEAVGHKKDCSEYRYNPIIFIDELDRCNPLYAIKMLERLKHLFRVPNVTFVLSIHADQLAKAIQGVYGPHFDGENYLRRFIDITYKLVFKPTQCVDYMLDDPFLKQCFSDEEQKKYFHDAVSFVADRWQLGARDIEQLCSRFLVAVRSDIIKADDGYLYVTTPHIIIFLIMLRDRNKALYDEYRRGGNLEAVYNVVEFFTGIKPSMENPKCPEKSSIFIGSILGMGFNLDEKEKALTAYRKWSKRITAPFKEQDEIVKTIKHLHDADYRRMYSDQYRQKLFDAVDMLLSIS